MTFHEQLKRDTEASRLQLISAPIIAEVMQGVVGRASYLAFLHEAYHHVRHTVPLLRACHDALPERLYWMRPALADYVEEETGHDEWILQDIAAAGGDAEATRSGKAGAATFAMVTHAYDLIAQGCPVGFLGMVFVLEGTSVDLALGAADQIQQVLGLPASAMTYLRSHGTLDLEHVDHYADLVNAIADQSDRDAVITAANDFFRLYGDVFRTLPLPSKTMFEAMEVAQ